MSLDVNLTVSKNTTSTSVSTGAIVNAGGQGIAGPLWVGGLANIAGAVTLQSTLALATANITGTPTITGSWTFEGFPSIRGTSDPATALTIKLYTATIASFPYLYFNKSASGSLGTALATGDGDVLGGVLFAGHNSANALATGAGITAAQRGAAGATNIPSDLVFKTATASAAQAIRAAITTEGNLSIASTVLAPASAVHALILGNAGAALGAATADMVSLACVDVSAGDAALQIHPETASLHRFGKQAYHKQGVTTGAVAVLSLEQLDVDQAMIDLACTIGTGNGIEAVAAKTLTTTHFVMVTIPGGLTRYLPVGTIA